MIRTRGTNITFSDLRSWIAGGEELLRRHHHKISRHSHDALAAHWSALEIFSAIAWIRAELDEDLLTDLRCMLQGHAAPWGKPNRGRRGGTKWERLNMETNNRRIALARARDDLGMTGHNSRGPAQMLTTPKIQVIENKGSRASWRGRKSKTSGTSAASQPASRSRVPRWSAPGARKLPPKKF
jgi:hypothetical protein